MLEERDLGEFAQRIQAEVIDRSRGQVESDSYEGNTPDFKENVFTRMMLDYMTDYGVIDEAEVCFYQHHTNKGKVKVNGYYLDTEENALSLFISLYRHADKLVAISKAELRDAFDQALRFFRLSTNGLHENMEPASPQFDMAQRIYNLRQNISGVRIYLFTDGITPEDKPDSSNQDKDDARYFVWDLRRLFRFVSSGMRELIEIDFDKYSSTPITCLPLCQAADDYMAYLAILPGEVLCKLYEEFGSRLLEMNVRSFLQAHGKVNRGIRDTLRSEPGLFMAYNNGISITADKIELASNSTGSPIIKTIRGLQIVNGGQTVASIHRAKKIDKCNLAQVYVQAKITIIHPSKIDEIVPKITRYANSQNKVNEADFSSNEPYHIELQRLSETIWLPGEQSRWFYERARGQYQVNKSKEATTDARRRQFEKTLPPSQRFSKVDLAKYINSWERLPHIVSLGGQKNFVAFMDRLRKNNDKDWKPDSDYYKELIGKAILFKSTETIIRQMKIPAYRANLVTYTIAYISHRAIGRVNFKNIWERQKISEGLEETIQEWCTVIYEKIISSAKEQNITEWCKKEDCWEAVREMNLNIPERFELELEQEQPLTVPDQSNRKRPEALTAEDYENIARVMAVDSVTWLKIHGWGKNTGTLEWWQFGIALTLSGLASGNWDKTPSAKQARHGVDILKIAAAHLNLEDMDNTKELSME